MTYRMGKDSRSAAMAAKMQGLVLAPKPDGEIPQIPRDITELSDRSLMELYAEMSAWVDFSAHQLACAVIDEKSAERRADDVERNVMLRNLSNGNNVTASRAAAKNSEEVSQAYSFLLEAEAYRRMVESISESCERNAAVISRELTRRTSSSDRNRRQGAWVT